MWYTRTQREVSDVRMEIPAEVVRVLERLESAGFEARLVGGCVRDSLLGRVPGDWDAATSALPEDTMRIFSGERVIGTGLKHGTVTVISGKIPVEVTTFRIDGSYSDGRRPDSVEFTPSLEEDLRRRDFTVNAMAYSPARGFCDPFGGREDLRKKLLRCVGEPERRFREDYLRILRLGRFASQLCFTPERETLAAAREFKDGLERVSRERVYAELTKLLCGPGAGQALRLCGELLDPVLPECRPMRGFDQKNPHHAFDLWEHTLRVIDAVPPEPALRWAALLHDTAKPACFTVDREGMGHFYGHAEPGAETARTILRGLHSDKATAEEAALLIENHMLPLPESEKGLRKLMSRLGAEETLRLLALVRADRLALAPEYAATAAEAERASERVRELCLRGEPLSLRDLAVSGRDLLALGIPAGPEMGKILRTLLEEVLSGQTENERAALEKRARELLG